MIAETGYIITLLLMLTRDELILTSVVNIGTIIDLVRDNLLVEILLSC